MGYRHGYLLKEKIEQNYAAIFDSVDLDICNFILETWNTFLNCSTPQEYLDEISGLIDGSGICLKDEWFIK